MTDARAIALLSARAMRIVDDIKAMRALATPLPLPIRVEVANLQEVLDLLRHKLREETLRRVIHGERESHES